MNYFTGTYVYDLKVAIKERERLPDAASLLKLSVKKPGGVKQDLDELRFKEGKFFNFSKLIQNYGINDDNPICVESPAPLTVLRPNPVPQEEIHPLRKWRRGQINEVLTKHQVQKQASKTDYAHRSGYNDIGITTTYSKTQRIKLGDIFEEHLEYYTESIRPIPASDLCTLSTLDTFMLRRSYRSFRQRNEARSSYSLSSMDSHTFSTRCGCQY